MSLQFDSEYLIMPVECMPVYGIIPELDIYIDVKKNRRPLTQVEKNWMFDQRQAWDQERDLAAIEGRPVPRFIIKQPNIVRDNLIKEPLVNSNTMSVFPPRRIIQRTTQEIERERVVNRVSR
jgi:hypothetical protein